MPRKSSLRVLVCFVVWLAGADRAAAVTDRTDGQRMRAVLGGVTTRQQLDGFAGKGPERCLASKPGFEVCQWWLAKADPGWKPLARAIETRARVALVCELPADGSARADFSCGAYPQASNRNRWGVKHTDRGRRRRSSDVARDREANHQRALTQLGSARTLAALCGVVGAIPDECAPAAGDLRRCLWRTTARTWGHGTLATTIGASYGKKIRMDCVLPDDGSARTADSCHVEVGA